MTQNILDFPIADKTQARQLLLNRAAELLHQALDTDHHDTFFEQEKAMAHDLITLGRIATQRCLTHHVQPQPHKVLIDQVLHTKVIDGAATLLTPFGTVRIPRSLYRPKGQRGAPTTGLLEGRCAIIEATTPRMALLIARFEASTTSRDAVELMACAGVCPPSRSRQEQRAGVIGGAIADILPFAIARSRAQDLMAEQAFSVTIGVDRVSVPYQEPAPGKEPSERVRLLRQKVDYQRAIPAPFEVNYHMDFVGCVSLRDEHGRKLASWRYGQSHSEPIEKLVKLLMEDVRHVLSQNPQAKVAVCQDGARELWPPVFRGLKEQCGVDLENVWAVVDWAHLWAKAVRVVKEVWGESACAGWKKILLNEPGGIAHLERELLMLVGTGYLSVEGHESLNEFLSYIEEANSGDGESDRRDKLFDYAGQRGAEQVIGSGDVEATCKSLVRVRMKRSGCRWKVEGARACLTLRALAISDGRFDEVFAHFVKTFIRDIKPLDDGAHDDLPSRQQAA